MIAVAAFLAGAVVSAALWLALRRQFETAEVLRRENHRGVPVPVAAGVVIVLAEVLVGAAYVAWARGGPNPRDASILLGGSLGFALIGLFDDVVGTSAARGFRGHLRTLVRGELTTGLVKLVWGVLLGFVVADGGLGESIRGGLVIAAAANLGNLFDRAPGRVIKVSLLGLVVLVLLGLDGWPLTGPALVVGAGAGLLAPDLRERCMLGDTGANVLGAAVGFGVVLACGATGEWIALAVLLALNLASEVVSFSRVIDRVPPLRWLDRLGTGPVRAACGQERTNVRDS